MWSPMEKCWVPNCQSSRDRGYTKNFFPLPTSARFKEIWLSLAGKKSTGLEDLIYFCQDHFDPNVIETYMDKFVCLNASATPYFNMPERICRTCMSIINDGDIFSVLSAKVPCTIPVDIKSEVLTCRPEPLLQVLNFCIPELNLSHDPLPLVCYECYHHIWLFYIFKLTCNAIEKEVLSNRTPAMYGKMVLCRSCPTSTVNDFFNLKEDSALGKLLKKMFLTNHRVEIVPLKVCLKCWNILHKLDKFYQQCLQVEQKMQHSLALNQYTGNTLCAPSTSLMSQRTHINHLKDYRKSTHPYPPSSTTLSSVAINSGSIDGDCVPSDSVAGVSSNIPSTSVIKFSGKQEPVNNSLVGELRGDLKFRVKKCNVENIVNTESRDELRKNLTASVKDEPIKIDVSDDEIEVDHKGKDSASKQRLVLTEKIALANLMLKHGAPLKANVSPKIHFEAWVNIVREFHELGYERSLEIIQKTWKAMKKKAEIAAETIGPATHINRLVIDYLKSDHNNIYPIRESDTVISKNDDVICIDHDVCNDRKVILPVQTPIPTVAPGSSQLPKLLKRPAGRPPAKPKRAREDLPTCVNKKKKGVRKKGVKKQRPRDLWSEERKLELVRRMRKQYDICMQNGELASGKTPWKMILKRLMETDYENYTFEKLYNQWCRMKLSATIHEKNGFDQVDEEVWDMLQIQNATQKSIVSKEANARRSGGENKRESDGPSTSYQESDKKDDRKTPSPPKKPIPKPAGRAINGDTSAVSLETKRTKWSEDEKMQLVKLMKVEYTEMLKRREYLGGGAWRGPWRKVISRVFEKGHNQKPLPLLFDMWGFIRRAASLNESKGQMSYLDEKVLRLLKLHHKTYNSKLEKEKKKTMESMATKKEPVPEDDDKELPQRDIVDSNLYGQQKLELIAIVMSYGGEVFKSRKEKLRCGFWSKVWTDFTAKGHNWEIGKVRCCWDRALRSAKQAWADQKEAKDLDKTLIDFMTEVIRTKDKNNVDDEKTDVDMDDDRNDEEDDSFDEISERRCESSNKSPLNSSSEDDKCNELNYDYVSFEDIQKGYDVDVAEALIKNVEGVEVKTEAAEEENPPFKIESYTSEQVIEILDSDED